MDVGIIVVDKVLSHVVVVAGVQDINFLETHDFNAAFMDDVGHFLDVRMSLGVDVPRRNAHCCDIGT